MSNKLNDNAKQALFKVFKKTGKGHPQTLSESADFVGMVGGIKIDGVHYDDKSEQGRQKIIKEFLPYVDEKTAEQLLLKLYPDLLKTDPNYDSNKNTNIGEKERIKYLKENHNYLGISKNQMKPSTKNYTGMTPEETYFKQVENGYITEHLFGDNQLGSDLDIQKFLSKQDYKSHIDFDSVELKSVFQKQGYDNPIFWCPKHKFDNNKLKVVVWLVLPSRKIYRLVVNDMYKNKTSFVESYPTDTSKPTIYVFKNTNTEETYAFEYSHLLLDEQGQVFKPVGLENDKAKQMVKDAFKILSGISKETIKLESVNSISGLEDSMKRVNDMIVEFNHRKDKIKEELQELFKNKGITKNQLDKHLKDLDNTYTFDKDIQEYMDVYGEKDEEINQYLEVIEEDEENRKNKRKHRKDKTMEL